MKLKITVGEVRGLRCVRARAVINKSKKLGIPRRYSKTFTTKTVAPNFVAEDAKPTFEAAAKKWEQGILAKIEREKSGVPEAKETQEEIHPTSYYATLKAKRKLPEKEGKEIPCPDCYGGHFRPCQVCGDSGVVTFISH